jgi:hypothetical protein
MRYWPPQGSRIEPTYAYDNPNAYPVPLSGIRINQHGRPLRMVCSSPKDIDRIARTPLLEGDDNLALRNLWSAGGAMNVWQRRVNLGRLPILQTWWFDNAAISANPSIIYFPGIDQFNDHHQGNGTDYDLDPTNWCVDECPNAACGWTVGQLDPACVNWWFDHCYQCGWTEKPAVLLDGQHRIRGMATTPAPPGVVGNHEEEDIFVSVICASDLINANMAAKVFIEVTGTAVDLDASHKDFLKSKYLLEPFDNPNQQRAYDIASGMNDTAAFWNMDAGANPRLGRVTMLDLISCDMINAAGGNKSLYVYIYQWLTQNIVISGYPAAIPLNGMANIAITQALDAFLNAANDVWSGAPPNPLGPGNMPNWSRDRFRLGGLQARQRFRTLIQLFPLITRRMRANADPLNTVNYAAELEGFAHFDWNSPATSNTYTGGDTGVDRTVETFRFLLENAIYPANTNPAFGGGTVGTLGPTLNVWLGDPLDPITPGAISSTVAALNLEFTATMAVNGVAIGPGLVNSWPPQAKRNATLQITNTTSGDVSVGTIRQNPATVNYGAGQRPLPAPAVGDVLDVELSFFSEFNNTPEVVTFPSVRVI